jgi:hypothetical protein
MPAKYALSIYRGDTGNWRFVLWTDDAKTQALDLTGASAAAQLRDGSDNITPLTAVITLPNIVQVTLAASDSAEAITGTWDLQVTFGNGTVQTMLAGPARVTSDITP